MNHADPSQTPAARRNAKVRNNLVAGVVAGALTAAIILFGAKGPPGVVAFFSLDPHLKAYLYYLCVCIASWLAMSVYWEIAASKVAAEKRSESRGSRLVHVVLIQGGMLLEIVPISALGRFMPPIAWVMTLGAVVAALGAIVAIWSRRTLGRNWSGRITIKVDHQLIRSGPYRWVRHPIYTAVLMLSTGTVLAIGTWLALIGWVMIAVAYARKIRLEEANLRVAFGADYDAYSRESRLLVPGLF
jgi:protein-S-isoprenylcysteine O-methyltransferase Ste14